MAVNFDRATLGKQLVGIHKMLAFALKDEIIVINDAQGDALADNLVDIAEHYGLTASKTAMLWINLAATGAMIYGPKVYILSKRGQKPKQQTPGVVVPVQSGGINFNGA